MVEKGRKLVGQEKNGFQCAKKRSVILHLDSRSAWEIFPGLQSRVVKLVALPKWFITLRQGYPNRWFM